MGRREQARALRDQVLEQGLAKKIRHCNPLKGGCGSSICPGRKAVIHCPFYDPTKCGGEALTFSLGRGEKLSLGGAGPSWANGHPAEHLDTSLGVAPPSSLDGAPHSWANGDALPEVLTGALGVADSACENADAPPEQLTRAEARAESACAHDLGPPEQLTRAQAGAESACANDSAPR